MGNDALLAAAAALAEAEREEMEERDAESVACLADTEAALERSRIEALRLQTVADEIFA